MGLHTTNYKGLLGWIDARMPSLMTAFRTHMRSTTRRRISISGISSVRLR